MAIVFSPEIIGSCNAHQREIADWRFALDIRAFRAEPVAAVTDEQLAEIVRRSREAARAFGIRDDRLVARFVMVDALISPLFYEQENVIDHFRQASGSADVKIGDIFQLIKITLRRYGRENEVWW